MPVAAWAKIRSPLPIKSLITQAANMIKGTTSNNKVARIFFLILSFLVDLLNFSMVKNVCIDRINAVCRRKTCFYAKIWRYRFRKRDMSCNRPWPPAIGPRQSNGKQSLDPPSWSWPLPQLWEFCLPQKTINSIKTSRNRW